MTDKERQDRYRRSPKGVANRAKISRERNAEWRRRIDAIKLAAGCADCGFNEAAVALDFDHVRGVKEFQIGTARLAWPRVMAEIAKCEVRCANCHRIRTFELEAVDDVSR